MILWKNWQQSTVFIKFRWHIVLTDACQRWPCGQCVVNLPSFSGLPSILVYYTDSIYLLCAGVLEQLIAKCVPDASARELCEFGDKLILEETSKVFKKEKDSKKGIAFSTCVSVNNCICHFSPIPSETDYILKAGDLAKM